MTRAASLVLLACLTACRPARPAAPADPPVPVAFDHVVIAIDSFARGVALLRAATGVTALVVEDDPVSLARTPGGGDNTQSALLQNGARTRSAIIGLGAGRYLELVGPTEAGLASPDTRDAYAIFRNLEPIAWGARTTDAKALRETLLSGRPRPGAIHTGAREATGIGTLRWRTLTPWANVSTVYPVLIEWDRSGAHPSAAAPAGCTLVTFTLGSSSAGEMRAALARAGVRATVDSTAQWAMALTLDCPTGEVRLPMRALPSPAGR